MFDLDPGKLVVFGIVALAVIPPKDLPRVLRTVGQYVGKMRRMASDFQGQFMEAMREADIESVKKEIRAIEQSSKIDASFDPVPAARTIDPPRDIGASTIIVERSTETPEAHDGRDRVDHSEPAAPSHSA